MKSRNKTETQKFWEKEISAAMKRENPWRKLGEKYVKRYRDGVGNRAQFNMLWANTEILKAATFSRTPEPNVARRYKSDGDIIRQSAELMEKALEFYKDGEHFTPNVRKARDDMLLTGRGVVWIDYTTDIEQIELEVGEGLDELGEPFIKTMLDGIEAQPDGFRDEETQEGPYIENVRGRELKLCYVYWKDFLHSDSRCWENVWWAARRHGMDKREIADVLGEDAVNKLERPVEEQEDSENGSREVYAVWEIWDKAREQRVWMTPDAEDLLVTEPVPCEVTGFFPCPRPIQSIQTNDTMIPVPEYKIYEPHARQINIIEDRLKSLTESCKAVGIYFGNTRELIEVAQNDDGKLVPVSPAQMADNGNLAQQIQWMPLGEVVQVIDRLEVRKQALKNEVYEITGISDIIRGSQDPSETATASRLKGSFGSLRLRPRREPIEEMIRDIYRIMAEIIADKFEPELLIQMTGMQVDPQVFQFLRNDKMRQFRIDVETDATVQPNQEIDKRNAVEFAQAMSSLLPQAIAAVQQAPQSAGVVGGVVKYVVQNFKAGRELEGIIDQTVDQMVEMAKKPQGPSPEQQMEMQKMQMEQAKLQLEAARIQANMQMKLQDNSTRLQEAQIRAGVDIRKQDIDKDIAEDKNATDIISNQLDVIAGGQG